MFRKLQKFRTVQQRERRRLGRFFSAVAVFLVLFLVVSAVYIGVHSGGFSFKKEETEEMSEEMAEESAPQVDGIKNLLLLCTSIEKTDFRLLTVLQINFEDNSYTISSFSPRETVSADGKFATLLEHYQTGGIKQLVRAVEATCGISIDRYITSTDNSFKRAINSMGPLVFTFPEQINYRCEDFAFVLIEGEQKMRGDDFLKYIRYCGALGDEGLKMQSAAVGECFKQYFTEKNLDKCDNLYSTLINTLSSDISVLDFKKSKAMLESMQKNDFEVNCIDYFRVIAN